MAKIQVNFVTVNTAIKGVLGAPGSPVLQVGRRHRLALGTNVTQLMAE